MNVEVVYRHHETEPWATAATLNLTGDPTRFHERLARKITEVEAPGFSDTGPVEALVRMGGDVFPVSHFQVNETETATDIWNAVRNPATGLDIHHNLGADADYVEGNTVACQAVNAVVQARSWVGDLSGAVTIHVADDDGPVADVRLISLDRTAYVRHARTGWHLQVTEFEVEDTGALFDRVLYVPEVAA